MTDYMTDDWPSAPPLSALTNRVHHADALSLLAALPDGCVDLILTDPPYGVLDGGIKWDTVMDWSVLWREIKRVLKPQSACVITSVQPFTSYLVTSNLSWFRQEIIWEKTNHSDFLNAKHRHLRIHENILLFSSGSTVGRANGGTLMRYYPQMGKGDPYTNKNSGLYEGYNVKQRIDTVNHGDRYPTTIIKFRQPNKQSGQSHHPTEKPVKLFEYLIKSYTTENDIVLDFFAGSGTTAVAARNLGRQFICCDISGEYVEVARKRLSQPFTPQMFIAADPATRATA